MALPAALQQQLRRALRSFRAANGILTVPAGSGKALEAWLTIKLAAAARTLPLWDVSLRRGDGSSLPAGASFLFPTGQSGIRPPNPNGHGFVLLEKRGFPQQSFELHAGLKWQGRSAATHECDVSLIPQSIAERLRNNGGGLPAGLPVVALECKDKTTAGTSDEMRQTLARLFDLALVTQPTAPVGPCRIWEQRTNHIWGRRKTTYVSFFAVGLFGIVRVGNFHAGARSLGHHYSINRFGDIYGASGITIDRISDNFKQVLQEISSY